jgi:hypothetical protein
MYYDRFFVKFIALYLLLRVAFIYPSILHSLAYNCLLILLPFLGFAFAVSLLAFRPFPCASL